MKKEWYAQGILDKFEANQNAELAGPMEAYMKNHFSFLGIKSPLRKQLLREQFSEYALPSSELLLDEAWKLFTLPKREYHYAAIALLDKMKKHLSIEDLPKLREFIETNSWWDSVDALAPIVGFIVKKERDLGEDIMKTWSASDNMWTNRAAILHQLKYKGETNSEFLFQIIQEHLYSNEFFIQKAIGWVLREYAKTNPDLVKSFVNGHPLKPLSKREALKHYK